MSKIFGHAPVAAVTTPAPAGMTPPITGKFGGTPGTATATATIAPPATTTAFRPSVDVDAVLTQLSSKHSEPLDWKKSIVDLMKLVGMDSSLHSRKELATELAYTGDKNDSATMNIWLHKQVLRKLAENGGKIPQNLLA